MTSLDKTRSGMSELTKRNIAWAVAATFMVLGIVVLLCTICVRVSANDHSKTIRDQQVRVACINHGGELLNGNNCVPIPGNN